MVRENLNPHVGVEGIVPTMYDGRTLHAREAVEILEENFGDLVFKTRIRKTVRYAEAPVKGVSVLSTTRREQPPRPTASWRRRCCMARKRASMREGPLAELFRATEAAQRQAGDAPSEAPLPPKDEEDEQQTLVVPAAQEAGSADARAAPGGRARGDGRARLRVPACRRRRGCRRDCRDRARAGARVRTGRRGRTGSRKEAEAGAARASI